MNASLYSCCEDGEGNIPPNIFKGIDMWLVLELFSIVLLLWVTVKATSEFNVMYVRVLSSVMGCILNGEGSDY